MESYENTRNRTQDTSDDLRAQNVNSRRFEDKSCTRSHPQLFSETQVLNMNTSRDPRYHPGPRLERVEIHDLDQFRDPPGGLREPRRTACAAQEPVQKPFLQFTSAQFRSTKEVRDPQKMKSIIFKCFLDLGCRPFEWVKARQRCPPKSLRIQERQGSTSE